MAGQIIQNYHVTARKCRGELLDIGIEQITVRGTLDHLMCVQPIPAQRGDEGLGV